MAQGIIFPSGYTYANLGSVVEQGRGARSRPYVQRYVRGIHQLRVPVGPDSDLPGTDPETGAQEINRPSKHQFNVGVTCQHGAVFGQFAVSHASGAFWQDVLDSAYHGNTQPYTSVNGAFGVKFDGGRYALSVKATNLGNQAIQQHIFGDVIKRQVVGEFKITLR
jgi:hypothetical protein